MSRRSFQARQSLGAEEILVNGFTERLKRERELFEKSLRKRR